MKKQILILLSILLIIPGVMIPKQEAHAAGFFGDAMKWVTSKAREKLFNGVFDDSEEEGKIDKKVGAKESESSKTSKVEDSVDTTSAVSNGTGVGVTNLQDTAMNPKVHYTQFQDSLSRFISILTVIGGVYLGISILRSLGMFFISIAQLSMIPSFPKARYFLLKNLMVSIICIALLGSVGLLTQLISGIVFS